MADYRPTNTSLCKGILKITHRREKGLPRQNHESPWIGMDMDKNTHI